jgi:hypothetical protein
MVTMSGFYLAIVAFNPITLEFNLNRWLLDARSEDIAAICDKRYTTLNYVTQHFHFLYGGSIQPLQLFLLMLLACRSDLIAKNTLTELKYTRHQDKRNISAAVLHRRSQLNL